MTNIDFNNKCYGFDFDGTLTNHIGIQILVKYLLSINKEVFICTKRHPDEAIEHGSDEVYAMAQILGIPSDNVIFTSNNDKSAFLIHNEIQEFWDDTPENLQEINRHAPDIITHLVR
jgi:hypothetical protein